MDEYVREFVDETEEAITRLNNLLLDLERSPNDEAILEEIFRTAHTLKGNAGAMGLDRSSDLAHAMEDLLDAIRAGEVEVTPDRMDTLFAAVDCLENMVDDLAVAGAIQTDPAETIAALRDPLSNDSTDVAPPPADELAAILTGFSPPSDPEHDAYLVRMAIADSPDLNNGLVVIEALIDAFDLIGTDPSRTAIENEAYGNRIDAVFGTAVGEAAISAALEPVDAVESFSILAVTDALEESDEDSEEFSPIDEDLSADISSDEANDMSVDELLDEFTELDDIDALAEEVEDVSEFDDIGDAGSFDDIVSESPAEPETDEPTAAADEAESESVEDAGAVFEELKQEVDMVGFDELQAELDELEFEEFDDEEIGMDELLGDDVDVDDPAFLGIEETEASAEPAADEASQGTAADASAREADSPTWSADAAAGAAESPATTETDQDDSDPSEPSSPASTAAPDSGADGETPGSGDGPEDRRVAPEETADSAEASATDGESETPAADKGLGGIDEADETPGPASPADDAPSSEQESEAAIESAFADELFSAGDDATAEAGEPAETVAASDETDAEPTAEAADGVGADSPTDAAEETDAGSAAGSEPTDETGVADDEASDTAVAFDLDQAADAPGEESEPDDGAEPTAVDAPTIEESGPEPGSGDSVEAESGSGDEALASGTADGAADVPSTGADDGQSTDHGDASADAVEAGPEDDTDGTASPDDSPTDPTETVDSTDDVAFGAEAEAFDISSGLDDLGSEFDEGAADSFAEDAETAVGTPDSWASDETGTEPDSAGDDSSWDGSEDPVDEVADFDSGLAFEDETAVASDEALESDAGLDAEDDFDAQMESSADGTAADAGFEDESTFDTTGTDFDDAADEESASADDVLAELPEMEIPDIDIPTTAEFDTDTDLEEHGQSVRVDREQVDSLLQLVEGLVTSRVRLRTAVDAREPYESIERELEELENFTTELQETVMDVRLVPLQTVTNRLPRVVRDLAREQDKQVAFDQSAADVELDRGILDEIGDPLIHLVRNAVDHGIEDTETREAADKPPEGTIELSAERTQNRVRIEISDDGSGLDPDRLREEAIEADILSRTEAEDLPDREAYDLVFHSGLSTADQVTDVSGRGVGMDVVRRTIDELNGTVSIDSTPGEGTTVSMTLPVSVAVDDVLFVESGGDQFGIPVDVVREITDGAYVTETDEGLVYDTDDETVPVIELDEVLETGETRIQDPDGMVVRIRDDVRDVGLKCDVVHARREVVVNPFEGFMRNIPGVSGATVRGRGEVITILDVSTI